MQRSQTEKKFLGYLLNQWVSRGIVLSRSRSSIMLWALKGNSPHSSPVGWPRYVSSLNEVSPESNITFVWHDIWPPRAHTMLFSTWFTQVFSSFPTQLCVNYPQSNKQTESVRWWRLAFILGFPGPYGISANSHPGQIHNQKQKGKHTSVQFNIAKCLSLFLKDLPCMPYTAGVQEPTTLAVTTQMPEQNSTSRLPGRIVTEGENKDKGAATGSQFKLSLFIHVFSSTCTISSRFSLLFLLQYQYCNTKPVTFPNISVSVQETVGLVVACVVPVATMAIVATVVIRMFRSEPHLSQSICRYII